VQFAQWATDQAVGVPAMTPFVAGLESVLDGDHDVDPARRFLGWNERPHLMAGGRRCADPALDVPGNGPRNVRSPAPEAWLPPRPTGRGAPSRPLANCSTSELPVTVLSRSVEASLVRKGHRGVSPVERRE
jgi:hypothetical protein